MVDLGGYLWGVVQLGLVVVPIGFGAYGLRRRLLSGWEGPPARLIETIVGVAILIWISEILGTFGLLYAGTLIAAALLVAGTVAIWPAGPAAAGDPPPLPVAKASSGVVPPTASLAGESAWALGLMVLVIAGTVFSYAVTTKHALDRGVFNFDSLWYHLPFAVDMVQTHSVVGMHHVDTVFTNWFYPQNSELLHGVGILLTGRDTLSLFLNLGWLAVAFLAAWCVGRPYGRGAVTAIAAAILLECHTLVVRDPGAAKNDLMAAALLLASIAILVEAWSQARRSVVPFGRQETERNHAMERWALAAAGLAAGLAAGTRVTGLAMAGALTVAVVVLAGPGRRWAAAGWWFVPAFLGGGFWYLRNLIVAGNPIPEVHSLGPISLPHPERLQEGRPDFSIVHYATDTGVWREYFGPGLHEAFGALWPLVVFGALAAALLALLHGRDRILRWVGAVALFGALAYLFTPLSAAGAEGEPVGFGINIRYAIPALLAGIVLLPLDRWFDPPELHQLPQPAGRKVDAVRLWGLMVGLTLVFLVTDRPDEYLHEPGRIFAFCFVVLVVLAPSLLLYLRSRGTGAALLAGAAAALVVLLVAVGYPLQRHYLENRFVNDGTADEQIPGMHLNGAYRWARGVEDARIGLAGTTAGFAGYGFYGTDLSNRVRYLGEDGPHGAFNAIPTCAAFRTAVDDADLDYLVTAPFLNFLHPGDPVTSPEARWLRGSDAVRPVLRSGPVTVWKVSGELSPDACGPANAPLRQIPQTPAA
jgi:hypothetical protein